MKEICSLTVSNIWAYVDWLHSNIKRWGKQPTKKTHHIQAINASHTSYQIEFVISRAVESESRSWSRKDFEPEESESQKILTTPTPGWPFARQLWLFVLQMFASVTLGNLSSLTFQQKMIVAIQKGCSTLTRMPTLRGDSGSAATLGLITQLMLSECNLSRFASLKFQLAFILVGTIVALWR